MVDGSLDWVEFNTELVEPGPGSIKRSPSCRRSQPKSGPVRYTRGWSLRFRIMMSPPPWVQRVLSRTYGSSSNTLPRERGIIPLDLNDNVGNRGGNSCGNGVLLFRLQKSSFAAAGTETSPPTMYVCMCTHSWSCGWFVQKVSREDAGSLFLFSPGRICVRASLDCTDTKYWGSTVVSAKCGAIPAGFW